MLSVQASRAAVCGLGGHWLPLAGCFSVGLAQGTFCGAACAVVRKGQASSLLPELGPLGQVPVGLLACFLQLVHLDGLLSASLLLESDASGACAELMTRFPLLRAPALLLTPLLFCGASEGRQGVWAALVLLLGRDLGLEASGLHVRLC